METENEHTEHAPRIGRLTLTRLRFRSNRKSRVWRNTYDENLTAYLGYDPHDGYSILFRNELNNVEYTLHGITSDDMRYTITANGHYITSLPQGREHEYPYGGNIDLDASEHRLSELLMEHGFRACPLGDYDDRTRLVRPINGGTATAYIHWHCGVEYMNLTADREGVRDGWTLTFDEAKKRLRRILRHLDAKTDE